MTMLVVERFFIFYAQIREFALAAPMFGVGCAYVAVYAKNPFCVGYSCIGQIREFALYKLPLIPL